MQQAVRWIQFFLTLNNKQRILSQVHKQINKYLTISHEFSL